MSSGSERPRNTAQALKDRMDSQKASLRKSIQMMDDGRANGKFSFDTSFESDTVAHSPEQFDMNQLVKEANALLNADMSPAPPRPRLSSRSLLLSPTKFSSDDLIPKKDVRNMSSRNLMTNLSKQFDQADLDFSPRPSSRSSSRASSPTKRPSSPLKRQASSPIKLRPLSPAKSFREKPTSPIKRPLSPAKSFENHIPYPIASPRRYSPIRSPSRSQSSKSLPPPKRAKSASKIVTSKRTAKVVEPLVQQSADNPLVAEKNKVYKEKLHDVELQVKKLEKAILISEQKEVELKREKQNAADAEKILVREANNELETLKERLGALKLEIDSISGEIVAETTKFKEFQQAIEQRRIQLKRESETLSHRTYTKDGNRDTLQNSIEELRRKIDIMTAKEQENENNAEAKRHLIHMLKENETKLMQRLHELDEHEESSAVSHVATIQAQIIDLELKLDRYRERYPLEINLIQQEEDYRNQSERYNFEKKQVIKERKNIQVEIDQIRKELKSREEENEKLRLAFGNYKIQQEEEIRAIRLKEETLNRFIELNEGDEKKHQAVQEMSKSLDQLCIQESHRQRYLELELEGIDNETERLRQDHETQFVDICTELARCYEDYRRKIESFKTMEDVSMHSKSEEIKDILTELEEAAYSELETEDSNLDKIASEIGDVRSQLLALRNADGDSTQLETYLYEIEQDFFARVKGRLVFRADNENLVSRLEKELVDKLLQDSTNEEKINILELAADSVMNKRRSVVKCVEQLSKIEFEFLVKQQMLAQYRIQYALHAEESVETMKFAISKRREQLENIKKSLAQDTFAPNTTHATTELHSEVTRKEEELRRHVDLERQRFNTFAQTVSELEDRLNRSSETRKQIESRWDEITSLEKVLESNYNKERVGIERQLAERFSGQDEQVLKQASERLASFKRLFDRLSESKLELEQVRTEAEVTDLDSIDKAIRERKTIQSELKELQQEAMTAQNEMKTFRDEAKLLHTQLKLLQDQLHQLFMEDQQSQQIQFQEYEQRDFRKHQIENIIQDLSQQEKQRNVEMEQTMGPLKKVLEQRKVELQKTTLRFRKAKKHVEDMKQKIEQTEAGFVAQISSIRGQRQHLKHRLDLKTKAIDNLRGGSNAHLKSHELAHLKSSNPPPTQPENTDPVSNTYFKMHLNKKKSGKNLTENDTPSEDLDAYGYDQELHDALLTSTHSVDKQLAKLHQHKAIRERDIITLEDLDDALEEIDPKPKPVSHPVISIPSPIVQEEPVGTIRLFGPHTRLLTTEEANTVVAQIKFMCHGTLLHKRKENAKPPNHNNGALDHQYQQMIKNNYLVRHISLSNEYTRLRIFDKKKKVAESFIKVEHMVKVVPLESMSGNTITLYGFSLVLQTKKAEFITFDEDDCKNWIEGLAMLIENKNHLFSLKYNLNHQKSW